MEFWPCLSLLGDWVGFRSRRGWETGLAALVEGLPLDLVLFGHHKKLACRSTCRCPCSNRCCKGFSCYSTDLMPPLLVPPKRSLARWYH